MGDDCDWVGLGNHDSVPRKTVRVREKYLTLVSKKVRVGRSTPFNFDASDIGGHPADAGFYLLAAEFHTLPSAGRNVFCSKAAYGDKLLVELNSRVSLPFLSKHWETLAIFPGACFSMELFSDAEPTWVVATFAVTRLRETR